MKKRVVISGALAQKPNQAGHTWQFLQYLLGFQRLGCDVLFIDRLEPKMCFDAQRRPSDIEQSVNLKYFLAVMERFGLNDSFALLHDQGESIAGLSRAQVLERARNSALLLNVMGYLTDEEILGCAPKRVFLDTDPGFGQMWQDLGLHDLFRGHDSCVTIGENIGKPDCTIPKCGLDWITTPQPVLLDQWQPQPAVNGKYFTSIGAWRGPYGPLEYRGRTYGLRVHEFRKFFALPRRSGAPFQVALDIHPAELNDLAELNAQGWHLIDPNEVARDPDIYRSYIQRSRAEFMVAKNMYVQSKSGWFSERSMCYLASGRPVLAQDTGLEGLYPTDAGLLTFTTLEEAAAGVEKIASNYRSHCRAARELAAAYFDSDKVLTNLLSKLSIA
jgi:hypothetical protein